MSFYEYYKVEIKNQPSYCRATQAINFAEKSYSAGFQGGYSSGMEAAYDRVVNSIGDLDDLRPEARELAEALLEVLNGH